MLTITLLFAVGALVTFAWLCIVIAWPEVGE